jgi:hypothetical protein
VQNHQLIAAQQQHHVGVHHSCTIIHPLKIVAVSFSVASVEAPVIKVIDIKRVPGTKHLFTLSPKMTFFNYGGIRLMITTPERTALNHPSATLTRIEMKSPARTTVPAASPSTCRAAIFSTKREAHDYFLLKITFRREQQRLNSAFLDIAEDRL